MEKLENSNNETIHFEQERAINQVRQRIFQQALQGALGTLNGCLNNELHLRMIDLAMMEFIFCLLNHIKFYPTPSMECMKYG